MNSCVAASTIVRDEQAGWLGPHGSGDSVLSPTEPGGLQGLLPGRRPRHLRLGRRVSSQRILAVPDHAAPLSHQLSPGGSVLLPRTRNRLRPGFSKICHRAAWPAPPQYLAGVAARAEVGHRAMGSRGGSLLLRLSCGADRCMVEADVRLRYSLRHFLFAHGFALRVWPLDPEPDCVLAGVQIQGTRRDAARGIGMLRAVVRATALETADPLFCGVA